MAYLGSGTQGNRVSVVCRPCKRSDMRSSGYMAPINSQVITALESNQLFESNVSR